MLPTRALMFAITAGCPLQHAYQGVLKELKSTASPSASMMYEPHDLTAMQPMDEKHSRSTHSVELFAFAALMSSGANACSTAAGATELDWPMVCQGTQSGP
jgi:hypothetical protein